MIWAWVLLLAFPPGMVDNLMQQYGPNGLKHPAYQSMAGSPASTPVLDSFAQEGMLFANVWAHSFMQ